MKTAISPWTAVVTAGVTLGLSVMDVQPINAQTLPTFNFSTTSTIDTYLDSSNATFANQNFGTGPALLIGQTTRNPNGTISNTIPQTGQQIPLLKFGNLPTLAPGQVAIVTSASLVLQGLHEQINVTSLVGNPIRGVWGETTATFNNTNSLIDTETQLFAASNPAIRRRTQGTTTYSGAGLTQLVQSWVNGSPNNGLALKALNTVFAGGDRSDAFASRENTQFPTPKLNLTYNIVGDLGWEFDGRVGGGSNPSTGVHDFRRDWETACTVSESQNPLTPPGPDHWFWRGNQNVPFELTWNRTTNNLSVIFGGDTNPNTPDLPDETANFPGKHTLNCNFSEPAIAQDFLRGFEISAFSQTDQDDTSCKTAAGSETFLRLTQIGTRQNNMLSFQNINVTSTAIAPSTNFGFTTRGSEVIFFSNSLARPIEVVRGTARMNWPSNCNAYLSNGKSRLQFKIQGLGRLQNPPTLAAFAAAAAPSSPSVPEPSVVLGLLAVGTLGIGATLKSKRNDDEN